MRCPISGFFQLVLGVLSKLTPNIINKSLVIFEIFSKEGFKLRPYDWNDAFMVAFMLSLSEADNTIEKLGYKWDMIHPNRLNVLK